MYVRIHSFICRYSRVPHVHTCSNCRHVAKIAIHRSMGVCTNTYIQTYILTCAYVYIHADVDTHVCHMYTPATVVAMWRSAQSADPMTPHLLLNLTPLALYLLLHTHTHTHKHARRDNHTHTHIQSQTHTRTHTHTHTHTQTQDDDATTSHACEAFKARKNTHA